MFALFTVCRIIYFLNNQEYFPSDNMAVVRSFLSGLIFDASTVAYVYLPFTILSLLPFNFQLKRWFQHFLRILFVLLTSVCVLSNLADTLYYKFSRKRSGIEAFTMLSDEGNPIGSYFITYWPWLLLFIFLMIATWYLYIFGGPDLKKSNRKWWFYLVVIVGMGLAARGSVGLKPIKTFDAARFVPAEFVPLTVNTPFNVISSFQGSTLEKVAYFKEDKLNSILPVEKMYFDSKRPPNKPNVVIFILESFSRDYCGWLRNDDLYTPFLDELSKKSLNFNHAYANGSISIHGLPAVMAGIPNFMEGPFINSSYQNNTHKNLGSLLAPIKYSSHFYQGADNGTMGCQDLFKIYGRPQ